jgi:hypothetical protein
MALTEPKLEALIPDEVMRIKFKDLVQSMPKNGVRATGLG